MGATPRHWDYEHVDAMLGLANRLHAQAPHLPYGLRGPAAAADFAGVQGGIAAGGAGLTRLPVLLEGARELVNASLGLLIVGRLRPGREGGVAEWEKILYAHTAGPAKPARRLLAACTGGDRALADPAMAKLLRNLNRSSRPAFALTRTRREMVDDRQWYATPHVTHARQPAGVDDSLYSARALACGAVACLCLCRPWEGRRPFDHRDALTLDLIHRNCEWVYAREPPRNDVAGIPLSPREREVLRKLLRGLAEKAIALEMGLSPNTVHHYVKSIYKRLAVSSRVELLAAWFGTRDS